MELRQWQNECLTEIIKKQDHSVIVAPPAAGKTLLAAESVRYWLNHCNIEHVIYLAAQKSVQQRVQEVWSQELKIPTFTGKAYGHPRRFNHDVTVWTYHCLNDGGLKYLLYTLETVQCALIADEFHHLADRRQWGESFKILRPQVLKSLMMSGTPFRRDKTFIPGVKYTADGYVDHGYRYPMKKAVRDRVCRRIVGQSIEIESPIAWHDVNRDGERIKPEFKRLAEIPKLDLPKAGVTLLSEKSDYLSTFVRKLCGEITILRNQQGYEDAGVLWVCPPGTGGEDDADNNAEKRYLARIADKIRDISHEKVIQVSADDDSSHDEICRFRDDKSLVHLCAIRMISEGVDIPRLRMLAIISWTDSELLLQQLAGRIARVTTTDLGEPDPRPAVIFYPAFAHLKVFFRQLEEETMVSANQMAWPRPPPRWPPPPPPPPPEWGPLFAGAAEYGDGVAQGTDVMKKFIHKTIAMQAEDPRLHHWEKVDLAYAFQSYEKYNGAESDGTTFTTSNREKRANLMESINRRAKTLAGFLLQNDTLKRPFAEHIKQVWLKIHQRFGVTSAQELFETRTIEDLERVLAFLNEWIKSTNH